MTRRLLAGFGQKPHHIHGQDPHHTPRVGREDGEWEGLLGKRVGRAKELTDFAADSADDFFRSSASLQYLQMFCGVAIFMIQIGQSKFQARISTSLERKHHRTTSALCALVSNLIKVKSSSLPSVLRVVEVVILIPWHRADIIENRPSVPQTRHTGHTPPQLVTSRPITSPHTYNAGSSKASASQSKASPIRERRNRERQVHRFSFQASVRGSDAPAACHDPKARTRWDPVWFDKGPAEAS